MKPSEELTDMLLSYYGELMQLKQETSDYFLRRKIERKMNVINELLDLPQIKPEFALLEVAKQMEENGGL